MHFWFSVYYVLTASACFEYYLLIIRRQFIYNNWHILCILCQLAATRFGAEPVPQQLVYFMHIMFAGCYQGWSRTSSTTIGIFYAYYVGWLLPGLEQNQFHNNWYILCIL